MGEKNTSNVLSLQDGVMCSWLTTFPRLNSKGNLPSRTLLPMCLWGECPGFGMRGAERWMNCTPMSDVDLSTHSSLPFFLSVGACSYYLIYMFSSALFIWLTKTGVFCEENSEAFIVSVQCLEGFDAKAWCLHCWVLQMRGYLTSSWNSQWRLKMQQWRES